MDLREKVARLVTEYDYDHDHPLDVADKIIELVRAETPKAPNLGHSIRVRDTD